MQSGLNNSINKNSEELNKNDGLNKQEIISKEEEKVLDNSFTLKKEYKKEKELIIDTSFLSEIASQHFKTDLDKIKIERLNNSFTNYIYRVFILNEFLNHQTIVMKYSTNKSILNGADLDESHLLIEYKFLEINYKNNIQDKLVIPKPILYNNNYNVIVMDDLGQEINNLYHIDYNKYKSIRFDKLGSLLKKIHEEKYPNDFLELIKKTSMGESVCKFKLGRLSEEKIDWKYDTPITNPIRPGVTLMDFSPRNCLLLANEKTIALLDFDFVCWADQLLDIAHFQTHILILVLNSQIDIKNRELIDSLLIGYFGEISNLEKNQKYWERFCRYVSACLYHRFSQHNNIEYAKSKFFEINYIFSFDKLKNWDDLYNFIINKFKL